MTVFPCVVRFARALIRAINDSFNSALGFSVQTFNAQCQLLATAFSTMKDGMRALLDAQHPTRSACHTCTVCQEHATNVVTRSKALDRQNSFKVETEPKWALLPHEPALLSMPVGSVLQLPCRELRVVHIGSATCLTFNGHNLSSMALMTCAVPLLNFLVQGYHRTHDHHMPDWQPSACIACISVRTGLEQV